MDISGRNTIGWQVFRAIGWHILQAASQALGQGRLIKWNGASAIVSIL